MFTVTHDARDRLLQKMLRRDAAEDEALRFLRRSGGWKLRLDRAHPADTTFAHKGRNVLLLDEVVAQAMKSMILETDNTAIGPQLRLRKNTSKKD
jgi:hypothetical protein